MATEVKNTSSGLAVPLINAGVQVGGTILDNILARRNAKIQTAENKKLADYQYNKQLEMWNMANEYNSPSSQMSRFKQAGLNPNLIYGQGSSGNTATTLPKYEAPTYRKDYIPLDVTRVLGAYQDFAMRKAQIDNVKQDTQNKALTNVVIGLNADWLKGRNSWLGTSLDPWGSDFGIKMQKNAQAISNSRFAMYNADYRKKQLDAFNKLLDLQIAQTDSIIRRNTLGSDLTQKDLDFYNVAEGSKIGTSILSGLRMLFGGR